MPSALVTDAGRGSALAVIRSLGRAGWRVIAADSSARSPGLSSRYAHAGVVHPSPRQDPAGYRARMAIALRAERPDVVLPITDEALLPLLEDPGLLAGARLGAPGREALEIVNDKGRTTDLALRLGVPVPRGVRVADVAQAERALVEDLEGLSFPLIVKPVRSRQLEAAGSRIRSFQVSYAVDRSSLLEAVSSARGDVLLQERLEGAGVGVELLARDGEVRAAFQHRRTHEVPVTGGASAVRVSEALDPELYAWSAKLAKELRWNGLMMVEFKRGRRTGLMEINGRVWGSLPLAVHCGVDFPLLWAKQVLEQDGAGGRPEPAPPIGHYRVGRTGHNDHLLPIWMLNVGLQRRRYPQLPFPPRRAALGCLLRTLPLRSRSDFFDRGDLRPWAAQKRVLLARAFGGRSRKPPEVRA